MNEKALMGIHRERRMKGIILIPLISPLIQIINIFLIGFGNSVQQDKVGLVVETLSPSLKLKRG